VTDTISSPDQAPRPRSALAGWLRALGHRQARTYLWLGPPFLLGIAAYGLASSLLWPGLTVAVIAGAVLVASMMMHESVLCDECMQATPLDVGQAVQKYRGRLRRIHFFDDRRVLRALFDIVALALLPVSIFVPPAGTVRAFSVLGVVLLAMVNNVTFLRAEATHNLLEPWCPWCDWGGGEDADEEPSPDPVDNLSRR
jgi:hypothetical protein